MISIKCHVGELYTLQCAYSRLPYNSLQLSRLPRELYNGTQQVMIHH